MAVNKLTKGINRTFHIVFFLLFGTIFVNILISSYDDRKTATILCGVLFLVIAVISCLMIYKFGKNISAKNLNITFLIVLAAMILLQIFMAFQLHFNPKTDLGAVNSMAKSYGLTGDFGQIYNDSQMVSQGYLARYTNNIGIFLLLAFYYRMIYLIFGTITIEFAIFLNIAAIDTALVFTFLISKKIFKRQTSLLTVFLCFFFLPFYTYTPFFYTDSLSLPFTMIAIYMFICALQSEKAINRYLKMFFCGAFVLLGFELKGSLIIIFAAVVIFLLLKVNFKQAITLILSFTISFVIFLSGFNSLVDACKLTNQEELYTERYPVTHWIMMGLKNPGGYNQDDSMFTRNSGNYDEKVQANIKEIDRRIKEYGVVGLCNHFVTKGVWTWSDGKYYIENHLAHNPIEPTDNLAHSFFLKEGNNFEYFYCYSNGFQLFILFSILISLLLGCFKPKVNYTTFLKIILFGVFIFFMIWETRSRYLFNFTPVMILIAASGIKSLSNFFNISLWRNNDSKIPDKSEAGHYSK